MPLGILLAFLALSFVLSTLTLLIGYKLRKKYQAHCLIVCEPDHATIKVNGKIYKAGSPIMHATKIGEKLDIEMSQPGFSGHQTSFIVRSAQSFYYCQLKRENHFTVLNNPAPRPPKSHARPQLKLV